MFTNLTPNQLLAVFILIGLSLGVLATFAVLLITRQQGTTATKIAIEVAQAVRADVAQLNVWEKAITETVPKETLAQIVSLTTAAISLLAGGAKEGDSKELATLLKQVITMISDGQPNVPPVVDVPPVVPDIG